MLNRHAITRRADDDGVDAAVVERDYVLSHIVAQLHRLQISDGGHLVFKGGTALRLVHIGNYRYSADLDFTLTGGAVEAAHIAIADVLKAARDHAGLPMLELTEDDKPAIAYIGPLGASKPRLIKLDLSVTEVVENIEQSTILPGIWSDLPDAISFDVYSIEEIAAEKLRCIIQRVRCRDLYDLFRLVEDMSVDLTEVLPLFQRKSEVKGIDPASFGDRFEDRLDRYEARWETEMTEHFPKPPKFDDVVRITSRHLRGAGLIRG